MICCKHRPSRRWQVSLKATPPPPPAASSSSNSKYSTLPINSAPLNTKTSKKIEGSPPRQRRRHSFTRKKDDSAPKMQREDSGGRSRLSSLSRMQEKLKRRLSRNYKSKDLAPEKPHERPSDKYWSSSPRMKLADSSNQIDGSRLCPLARTSSMRHGPPKTISGQFQASLLSLMERLEDTNPFFVRCLKSNGEKVSRRQFVMFKDDNVRTCVRTHQLAERREKCLSLFTNTYSKSVVGYQRNFVVVVVVILRSLYIWPVAFNSPAKLPDNGPNIRAKFHNDAQLSHRTCVLFLQCPHTVCTSFHPSP